MFAFSEAQMVEHVQTLARFYHKRCRELAADLVAGRLSEAAYESELRELVAFVGEDTVAMVEGCS